jgi:Phospholipase B
MRSALGIDEQKKGKIVAFMTKQDYWLRSMIVTHPKAEDTFWRHVSYIIAQFDGLYAGYKSVAEPDWVSARGH